MTLILNGKWINLSQVEGTNRSKMLKTAIYSSIKKNDHDDGLGPAWPEKGEMHTKKNG